ncbi:uncharacterized protein J3D65DRAFT_634267 [Phyllosticta citribraziliensis]|uniref:Gag protein n=1 Tax=Phyllosticta citribraziliensis TaxID=989973 RepID=A0ABR1LCV9_9PEZI
MDARRVDFVLSQPSDWDVWIFVIKTRALSQGIWNLIDPSEKSKPQEPGEPTAPSFMDDLRAGRLQLSSKQDELELQLRMAQMAVYTKDLEERHALRGKINAMAEFIIDRVSLDMLCWLAYTVDEPRHHPWDILRLLQQKVAPTALERERDIRLKIKELEAQPPSTKTLCEHLETWDRTIARAAKHGVRVDGNELASVFLGCIARVNEAWAAEQMESLIIDGEDTTARSLIDKFRSDRKVKGMFAARGPPPPPHLLISNGAANASNGSESSFPSTTLQTPDAETRYKPPQHHHPMPWRPLCPCGKYEYFPDCAYFNRAARPPGWVPNPVTQEKVATYLTDPANADRVEKSLDRWRKIQAKFNPGWRGLGDGDDGGGGGDEYDARSDSAPLWRRNDSGW